MRYHLPHRTPPSFDAALNLARLKQVTLKPSPPSPPPWEAAKTNPSHTPLHKKTDPLMEASKGLEALMVKLLFKQMKKNGMQTNFLKGGFAEEIFDDFLTEEFAKKSVNQNNFGLATLIYNQLSGRL